MEFNKEEIHVPVPWGHIAAVKWNCGKTTEEEAPVLCIHGLKDNANSFVSLIPLLPKNRDFICLDLPGHGRSSHFPPGLLYDITNFVLSLRLFVSQLQLSRFSLLGHSIGGGVCTTFSALYPKMVEKLVVIDSGPLITPAEKSVKHLRQSIDEVTETQDKGPTESPVFSCLEDSVAFLLSVFKKADRRMGANDIGEADARNLLARGLVKTAQGYRFSCDPRLNNRMVRQPLICLEQGRVFLEAVRSPTLMLWSSSCTEMILQAFGQGFLEATVGYAELLGMTVRRVQGSHSVHMSYPERVSGHINQFLGSDETSLKLKSRI